MDVFPLQQILMGYVFESPLNAIGIKNSAKCRNHKDHAIHLGHGTSLKSRFEFAEERLKDIRADNERLLAHGEPGLHSEMPIEPLFKCGANDGGRRKGFEEDFDLPVSFLVEPLVLEDFHDLSAGLACELEVFDEGPESREPLKGSPQSCGYALLWGAALAVNQS